jgi:hypothetical protein
VTVVIIRSLDAGRGVLGPRREAVTAFEATAGTENRRSAAREDARFPLFATDGSAMQRRLPAPSAPAGCAVCGCAAREAVPQSVVAEVSDDGSGWADGAMRAAAIGLELADFGAALAGRRASGVDNSSASRAAPCATSRSSQAV